MRYLKSCLCAVLVVLLLAGIFSATVLAVNKTTSDATEATATVPYTSYIYNYDGEPIVTPHAYLPSTVLSAGDIGLKSFDMPSDIAVNKDSVIFVVDTEYIPDGSKAADSEYMASINKALSTASSDSKATESKEDENKEAVEKETESDFAVDESTFSEDMRSDISVSSPYELQQYIEKLPDVSKITIEYGSRVEKLLSVYDKFTDDQRVQVENRAKLEAIKQYLFIDAPVVANTAAKLDEYIAVLPTDSLSIKYIPRVRAIREAYNKLSSAEKAKITGMKALNDAENMAFFSAAIDVRDAESFDAYVNLLPNVESITKDYSNRIDALLIAYRGLTADEKILVTQMAVLEAIEYKLDEILCKERHTIRKGRIVAINKDNTLKFSIEEFNNDGHEDGFFEPGGVAVAPDGTIYVADTENSRIIQFTADGQFIRDIKNPQISQIGNIKYMPDKLSVDNSGNMYVVCKSVNMGIVLLDENGDFVGFVGAQQVTYSAVDYLWKSILTEEQQDRMESFVPMVYNNICLDSSGFAYATTSSVDPKDIQASIASRTATSANAPVKRLNPSGKDVLLRRGYYMPCGDISFDMDSSGRYETSYIVDVAVNDARQRYTILDTQKNRIFTYSKNGDMLYAFGGEGGQKGNFSYPISMVYDNDDLLVLDRTSGSITRFNLTEYGTLIDKAYEYYYEYEYDKSVEVWKQVLNYNANFDIAYDGIADSYMRMGEYKQAMEYYRYSNNQDGYSDAFDKYRTDIIEHYLLLIILIIAVAIFLIVRIFKYFGKRNRDEKYIGKREGLWSQMCYAMYVIIHPFDGFWDLKHEKRGSVKSASIFSLLVILVNIASGMFTSYLFNKNYGVGVDIIKEIVMVLGPALLWTVANWSVTTLVDGEGKMKDIYIFTAYSLTPTIILSVLSIILSQFMVADEAMYITFIGSLSTIWCGFLVFAGNTTIHRYTVGKSILAIIVSIIGIGVIIFVLMVLFTTYLNMYTFISNVVKEIAYRM